MPVEQNPYEAIPLEPPAQDAGKRRRLTIGESIAAFMVTLIMSSVTLFVTCLGVFGFGSRFDAVRLTGDEVLDTVVLILLAFGVPILLAAIVGRLTLRSFIRAVTAASANNSSNEPQSRANPAFGADGTDGQGNDEALEGHID